MARETTFPFKLTREHIAAPVVVPAIDFANLERVDSYLNKVKKPLLDEITTPYDFRPDKQSIRNYTGFYAARHFISKTLDNPGSDGSLLGEQLTDISEAARQVTHIAERAEIHHGFFWATAETRKKMLQEALSHDEANEVRDSSVWAWSVDSVIDVGYCMLYPHSVPEPTSRNPRYTLELATDYYGVGRLLEEDPAANVPRRIIDQVFKFACNEQERRIYYHKPRYQMIVEEFGVQAFGAGYRGNPTTEELLQVVPAPLQ